jgi:hypothetical protein
MINPITIEKVVFYKDNRIWTLELFTTYAGGAGRGEELPISAKQAKQLIEMFDMVVAIDNETWTIYDPINHSRS